MTADELAQIIRAADGENKLGAGALAEAILAAAPSASMGRVRELEWRQPSGPWTFVADALGITYRLSQGIGDDTSWELRLHNSLIGTYPSKDDGLKAGQSDFERLMSQWLDSPPYHGGGEGALNLGREATRTDDIAAASILYQCADCIRAEADYSCHNRGDVFVIGGEVICRDCADAGHAGKPRRTVPDIAAKLRRQRMHIASLSVAPTQESEDGR